MHYQRAAIIGIGLIGGSFGLAVKRAGLVDEVVGVARSETTRALAVECGAADWTTDDRARAVREADLVYLATPIGTILSTLAQLGPHLKPGALVTDAGSTKSRIVAAAAALPPAVAFLGGHPMAGSEQAGVAAARADLFQGATYLLTPTATTAPETLERMLQLVQAIGAEPLVLEPELHDRMVAVTSHLPHALAWALCAAAARREAPAALAPFAAGAWRDTTRIAASPEQVWADIFLTNPENLAATARDLRDELDELLRLVESGDRPGVLAYLARSRAAHERMAPGDPERIAP
jgi:prephenate dehydrogenase